MFFENDMLILFECLLDKGGMILKRNEVLERLGYKVPELKKKRVIVHSCEADDQFAIVQHLLTPYENVLGIIAGNFEQVIRGKEENPDYEEYRFHTMEKSYHEGEKILEIMDIDDIPLLKGAIDFIKDKNDLPVSEGSKFIIEKSLEKLDDPLYIAPLLICQ